MTFLKPKPGATAQIVVKQADGSAHFIGRLDLSKATFVQVTSHDDKGVGYVVCKRPNVWTKLLHGGALYDADPCLCCACTTVAF